LDAIKAVLWPNKTDYYYFCANIETKEPYYARTNEEHEANLIKAGIDINDIDYDD
ncbi:MAG: endolytic transglycosylase MltG, partial [Oscillospiraceae bacterium]|nr:endolytic transglycosylase MltG [Oscillospiraceae bacterium]